VIKFSTQAFYKFIKLTFSIPKSSPKNWRKIINEALNRKSISSDQIENILNNGDSFTDSKEIADT
jgi:hypothetical protein